MNKRTGDRNRYARAWCQHCTYILCTLHAQLTTTPDNARSTCAHHAIDLKDLCKHHMILHVVRIRMSRKFVALICTWHLWLLHDAAFFAINLQFKKKFKCRGPLVVVRPYCKRGLNPQKIAYITRDVILHLYMYWGILLFHTTILYLGQITVVNAVYFVICSSIIIVNNNCMNFIYSRFIIFCNCILFCSHWGMLSYQNAVVTWQGNKWNVESFSIILTTCIHVRLMWVTVRYHWLEYLSDTLN